MFKMVGVYFWAILILLVFNGTLVKAQENEDSLYNEAVLNVYDNPDKAIEFGNNYFKKNLKHPKKQVSALLLISNAYASKRDYQKSLEFALKTKQIPLPESDQKLQIQILNKIAAQYHQLGVNDKALEILDEADLISANYPHKDSIQFLLGNNDAIRGFIYRDQLSCDVAINYLKKAYQEFSSSEENSKSMANKSVTSYNIANCYVSLNQLNLAKSNYTNAKNLGQQANANSLTAFAMKGLAEVYTLESHYEQALIELKDAEKLAEEVGDLVLNRGIYQGLATNYLALKDWDNYHRYNEKFEEVSLKIKESERTTINQILDNYSTEILQKESDLKFQSLIILGSLILVLFGIIFWIIKSQKTFQIHLENLKSKIKI